MNNIVNVYLSSFEPDNMKLLVEFLKYDFIYLKNNYYEVSFEIGKEKNNELRITEIKKINDVFSYFESVFKNRSIKEYKLDEESAKEVIELLCEELIDKNGKEITQKIDKTVKINLDSIVNTPLEDNNNQNNNQDSFNNYLDNKKSIKNYLNSKKGIK